ncbi:MAG: hypothetical protein PWQ87_717, partial [Candidatus Woesearchaeota archaeon]|nr:hypothetical protein [Candidatus Woesearchaeota archaeon]
MVDEEAKRKRIEEINKEILKIKEARERISQDYLNDKISFDEYKKRLKNELGYYDIDKRLLELYDEKKRLESESSIEIHSSKINEKEKTEKNQIKARKNLPKKKRIQSKNIAILVVIAGLIGLAIFGFNGFRESGITGYFAIDSNETTESLNQTPIMNQSSLNETLDSENATAVEISNQTEDIEENNITKNAEENGTIVEETTENETSEEGSNISIINETPEVVEDVEGIEETEETILPMNETQEENNATNETEGVIEEEINGTTNETINETIAEINQTMNQTEPQTENETINITNTTEITNITNESFNETIE